MVGNLITWSLTPEENKAPTHARSANYDLDNGYGFNIYTNVFVCVAAAAIGGGLNRSSDEQLEQLVMLAAIGGALYGGSIKPILSSVLDAFGLHKGLAFEGFNHANFSKNTTRRILEDVLGAVISLLIAHSLWKSMGHQTKNSASEGMDMMAKGAAAYEAFATLYTVGYNMCCAPTDRQTTTMNATGRERYDRPGTARVELVEYGNANIL